MEATNLGLKVFRAAQSPEEEMRIVVRGSCGELLHGHPCKGRLVVVMAQRCPPRSSYSKWQFPEIGGPNMDPKIL